MKLPCKTQPSYMGRLLLGHPYWGRGGAEVAAMWVIEALCHEFKLDLVTRGGWNLEELNRCAGTAVPADRITLVHPPCRTLLACTTGGAVWMGFFNRYRRHIAPRYDLCITLSRVFDWGVPAVHFLSDVSWTKDMRVLKPRMRERLGAKLGLLIAGNTEESKRAEDLFVANSEWTAKKSAPFCTSKPLVIHPAVPGDFPRMEWARKKNDFVFVGRIAREKRIEEAIAILEQVRVLGHDIGLHLLGAFDGSPYADSIRALCDSRPWIIRHGAVFGDAKVSIVANCRYAINACQREAFGIATAEMCKAGVVPFVFADGGQPEIVQHEQLVFSSQQEAVAKIHAVLQDNRLQEDLHEHVLAQASRFAPERFCMAVREIVHKKVAGT